MCNKKIIIFFIVFILFLLLGFKNAFAYEQTYNDVNFIIPDEIISQISTLPEYSDDNRYVIIYAKNGFGQYEVCFPFKGFKPYMTTRNFGDSCVRFSDDPISLNYYCYDFNTLQYTGYGSADSYYTGEIYVPDGVYYLYCTEDIYSDISYENLFYQSENSFVAPSFSNNIEGFENNSFQSFFIDPGDVPGNEIIKFTIRNDEYLNLPTGTSSIGYIYNIDLDENSPYYIYNPDTNTYFYQVPKEDVIIPLLDKNTYTLMLFYGEDYKHVETTFTIGLDSDEEVILTDLNKTNKNIFSKIGDIFNLLNPLSDQFFLYVALDKLFIPSDNFFNNWLSDFNSWLGDRFDLVYYPIELVLDFLTRIGNIAESDNFIISWPNLDIFGATLIAAGSYDFNSLLLTEEFNNIHEIYLLIMDVIFYLLLVLFAKNVAAEVFGGRFSDEVIGDITSSVTAPERSYKRYVRHQENKKRYRKENGG